MPSTPSTHAGGRVQRPLSPHLGTYKPQLTAVTSILHRITGVALVAGLPVLVLWLVALAHGPASYGQVEDLLKTCLGQIFLFGWTWAFFYHFCNGVRHLIWDTGRMLSLNAAYKAGYAVIATSALLTALIWGLAYGVKA